MILQVRAGQMTATEAAKRLGISRKTYYQWEQRALSGMLAGLENGNPGRPPAAKPDLEISQLKEKVAELEDRLKVMAEVNELRAMLAQIRPPKPAKPSKAKRPTKAKKKT
jgi:transposase